jgi:hypothetical protein
MLLYTDSTDLIIDDERSDIDFVDDDEEEEEE